MECTRNMGARASKFKKEGKVQHLDSGNDSSTQNESTSKLLPEETVDVVDSEIGQSTTSHLEPRVQFPLTSMPQELMWQILDWVPEAFPHLRATSRGMQQCADAYAAHSSTFPLVVNCDWRKRKGKGFLLCRITVSNENAALFECCMEQRHESFGLAKPSLFIKRTDQENGARIYEFEHTSMEDGPKLDFMNACISKQSRPDITLYSRYLNDLPFPFTVAAQLLKGISGRSLILDEVPIDDDLYQLMSASQLRNYEFVKFLELHKSSLSHPSDFQYQLLSNTRKVVIVGSYHLCLSMNHYFGLSQAEWSRTIIHMFEHEKLEELYLSNSIYPEYLDIEHVILLRERLPFLKVNKKIRLECAAEVRADFDYILNDYHIRGGPSTDYMLIIEHSSYCSESCMQ